MLCLCSLNSNLSLGRLQCQLLLELGNLVKGRLNVRDAALVAISTCKAFAMGAPSLERVVFCCFSAADKAVYDELLTNPDQQE